MTAAVAIRPDGTTEDIQLPDGDTASLARMQDLVGGYVEAAYTPEAVLFFCEDGRALNMPPNQEASLLAAQLGLRVGQLVGTVVVTGPAARGDVTPIRDNVRGLITD